MVDRFNRLTAAQKWTSTFTHHFTKELLKPAMKAEAKFNLLRTSEHDFTFTVPREYSKTFRNFRVSLTPGIDCSCGTPKAMLMPCEHALAVIRRLQLEVGAFSYATWKTDTYLQAYAEPMSSRPFVSHESLTKSQPLPLSGSEA